MLSSEILMGAGQRTQFIPNLPLNFENNFAVWDESNEKRHGFS
jgi:hypothetical protein